MTNLNRILEHRDAIAQTLRDLDPKTLTELVRRSQHPAVDAYPASTVGGGGSNDVSKPVERKILACAGGTLTVDPTTGEETSTPDVWLDPVDYVSHALETLFAELAEMAGHARRVDRLREYVQSIATTAAGRQTSLGGDCRACDRPVTGLPADTAAGRKADRLVSGYCPGCRKAWERAGYPDRARFEKYRPKWEPTVVDTQNPRSLTPPVDSGTS